MSFSEVENSFLNPETIDKVYIDLVRESIDQIDEFLDYVADPDNFSKPDYIKKVLAWQKFVGMLVGSYKARGYRHAHKWDERSHFVPSIYNY